MFQGVQHFKELPCNADQCRAPNVFFVSDLGQMRPLCAHAAVPSPAVSGPTRSKRQRSSMGLPETSTARSIKKQYIDKADDCYCKPDESLMKLICESPHCAAYSICVYKPRNAPSQGTCQDPNDGDRNTSSSAAMHSGNVAGFFSTTSKLQDKEALFILEVCCCDSKSLMQRRLPTRVLSSTESRAAKKGIVQPGFVFLTGDNSTCNDIDWQCSVEPLPDHAYQRWSSWRKTGSHHMSGLQSRNMTWDLKRLDDGAIAEKCTCIRHVSLYQCCNIAKHAAIES